MDTNVVKGGGLWDEAKTAWFRADWRDPSLETDAIAAKYGISTDAARKRAKRLGEEPRVAKTGGAAFLTEPPWTPEQLEVLKANWEDLSKDWHELSRLTGKSVQACQTKGRRLGWTPRSRIGMDAAKEVMQSVSGPEAPPVPAMAKDQVKQRLVRTQATIPDAAPSSDPPVVSSDVRAQSLRRLLAGKPKVIMPAPKFGRCRFIMGDVGTPEARWCEEKQVRGVYCAHHATVCYRAPGETWRDDAAKAEAAKDKAEVA